MLTIGFLHAEADQVGAVRHLLAERAPAGVVDVHLVERSLVGTVPETDAAARGRLGVRLGELIGRDVDVVVCTCPVWAPEVTRLARRSGVPAVGVDELVGSPALVAG